MPTVNGPDEITDLEAGNDKVFYSDSSGDITEVALGAAATVLTSAGATSAPTFAVIPADATVGANKAIYSDNSDVVAGVALGAAGTVLTSGGTTAAPTFSAIPASGGTKEMVATGAIASAGISVALNSDGTVSAVADARVTAGFGRYAAATTTAISITMTRVYGIYHAEQDAVVIFYPSNEYSGGAGNYRLYSAAASISGTTLTFGSSIQIDLDYGGYLMPYAMAIAYDPDTYKVWYMWNKDNQSGGTTGVTVATATVSGTTVTKTSLLNTGLYTAAAGSQDNAILTYDTTNDQMVACWSSYTGTGSASWFVVTESGGTITANTALVSTTSYVVMGIGNMVWLPTVARMVCWGGRGNNRSINTISVSGTTLSIDQQDIYTSNFGGDGQYGHENWIATTSDGTKVIAGGREKTTSYVSAWNCYTITAGGATTAAWDDGKDLGVGAYQRQGASITRVGTTDTYVIQIQGDHVNYFGTFELGALDTAVPTLTLVGTSLIEDNEGTDNLDGAVGTNCNDGWMGLSHNTVISTSQWMNPTYKQAAASMITPASGATTAVSWLGISEAAISDGATGSITVTSGTNTGLTGLTIGKTYFMQADGSLAITKDSPTDYGLVGPALSATSILVQGVGDTTTSAL
tara:strand:- start:6637 stop:8538 length:1902 start_codon:yes stop_codon:yes gene_type:complete